MIELNINFFSNYVEVHSQLISKIHLKIFSFIFDYFFKIQIFQQQKTVEMIQNALKNADEKVQEAVKHIPEVQYIIRTKETLEEDLDKLIKSITDSTEEVITNKKTKKQI